MYIDPTKRRDFNESQINWAIQKMLYNNYNGITARINSIS